jgi:hypothetical protein
MKRSIFILMSTALVLCHIGFGSTLEEDEVEVRDKAEISFRPCGLWTFYYQSSGYVCALPKKKISVYTASDVDATVETLRQQIQTLEARIRKLEGKPDL